MTTNRQGFAALILLSLCTQAVCLPSAARALPKEKVNLQQSRDSTRWQINEPEASIAGATDLFHTSWGSLRSSNRTAVKSTHQQDHIQLHRYRARIEPKATLFYLPGTWMNGASTETDERYNLWHFLARRGVEVFTLDYRTHAVPPETEDLSFFRHWTVETFAEDVRVAGQWVRHKSDQRPIFVAGFSRGVSFAYAYAASRPSGVEGIVALDGYFKHHTPRDGPSFEHALEQLEESGQWAQALGRSQGWNARQQLMATAARDPMAPPLGEKAQQSFDTVGQQLGSVLFHAWGPGALANPIEGPHEQDRRGASSQGESKARNLARLLHGYDRFYPRIQDLEGQAFANTANDPRTSLDDGWEDLEIPVIYFGSTGMGNRFLLDGIFSAVRGSGGKAEVHVLEGYGHLDVLVGEEAHSEVYKPILRWIDRISQLKKNEDVASAPGSKSPTTDSGDEQ